MLTSTYFSYKTILLLVVKEDQGRRQFDLWSYPGSREIAEMELRGGVKGFLNSMVWTLLKESKQGAVPTKQESKENLSTVGR